MMIVTRETLHPLAPGRRRGYGVIPCACTAVNVVATSGKLTGVSLCLVFPATDPVSTADQAMEFVIEAGRMQHEAFHSAFTGHC